MRKGISRDELGRLTGLSYKQVGLIERGIAKYPREENILAIAEVLEVQVDELFPPKSRIRPPRPLTEEEKKRRAQKRREQVAA